MCYGSEKCELISHTTHTCRYKPVQMETIGKQIDCILAFLGFTVYIVKEVHVPPTLELYLRKDLVLDFVAYLQARGVGR